MAVKLRGRKNGHMLELWDGPPGESESDLVMSVDEALLPEVERQLRQVHKWPSLPKFNGWCHPVGSEK